MTDYQLERDQTLKDQNRGVLYQENDWMVGDTDGQATPPDHPLISHWCRGSWNYVFSSEYAMEAFKGYSLYKCSGCEERAPDDIITIHMLMIK